LSLFEVSELVIDEECAEQIPHLHVDIAFAERSSRDFGCGFGNVWDRLHL